MSVGWRLLLGAIAAEIVATLSLKGALDHPEFYAVVVAGYITSFALFAGVLRWGMGLGVAYGVWGAFGVSAVALASSVIFAETLSPLAWIGIALVVLGVLVVELGQGGSDSVPGGAPG